MRGEILQYDDGLGTGLISGDDGVRYSFQRADLQQLRPVSRGMRVDFVPDGPAARQIFALDAQPQSAFAGPIESTNEDLSLWGYFAKAMGKSFNGEGRARRKEYWSFVLFQLIFLCATFLIIGVIMAATGYTSDYGYGYGSESSSASILVGLGVIIFVLVFIPAGITVTIRRLHDIGLTGWFIFISLIPYLGSLVLLIMSLIPSERRVNKHGPYPKPLD